MKKAQRQLNLLKALGIAKRLYKANRTIENYDALIKALRAWDRS